MRSVPEAEAFGSDLPYVSLYMDMPGITHDLLSYQIRGGADEDPPSNQIESSFELTVFGNATDPEQWRGLSCEVMLNRLSISHEEGVTDQGFIGDGYFDPAQDRLIIRLTLPLANMRDLINYWIFLGRDRDVEAENRRLRCDLVHLRQSADFRGRDIISFMVIGLYCQSGSM